MIKKYLVPQLRVFAMLMAVALGSYPFVAPQVVEAQSASEKIRLMAEVLRARDSGNLDQAKEKAEELIKIAPDDENVQRLLAAINADMDRRDGTNGPVYGQVPEADVESAMEGDELLSPGGSSSADALADAAASEQDERIAEADRAIDEAEVLAEVGSFQEASALLSSAAANLTLNTATAEIIKDIEAAQAELIYEEAEFLAENDQLKDAEQLLGEYLTAGGDARKARLLARKLDKAISDPYDVSINEVSRDYVDQSATIRDLLTRGRAQFLNGDYEGASATFKEVEARDANNSEAKLFSTRIAEILGGIHAQNRYKTREQMLSEVDQGWERPKVFDIDRRSGPDQVVNISLQRKMENIVLPQVNFSGMELTRVIDTLFELSKEYDSEGEGVNIVPLFDANESNPRVNISLRNLNLDRILQFVTQQVNFTYDVGADAVTVSRSDNLDGVQATVTEFFPISRATVIRLTGFRDGGGGGGGDPVDPFAPAEPAPSGPSASEEVEALQSFFQSAGVNFELPGTSIAFDGEQLIVTQTRRNLERMRTILRNYNEVKQVEIEAKFLEVSQADLEELGFDWRITNPPSAVTDGQGFPVLQDGQPVIEFGEVSQTQNRSLNSAFGIPTSNSAITINGEQVAFNNPPQLTDAIDLAADAGSIFTATGWSVNGYDVDFAIRALARKTGSDLMSAPKVTVLSGKRANITVAQELRYPESYGDIESTASQSGGDDGGGSAAISITAGTPQDFVTRNVGVEMAVTPNVENDDTISLILEPRVTEFEGFVEYGGPSVAITGDTAVTVPAGFFQPVFSTRELATEVTIFDGATVVMGGLTRDDVRSVKDKVPVLGDIPGVGRLFRSEGETRQKRNLLIFVTANLVSPGGSPARQNYRTINANSLFQNPTIMTPAGTVNRSIDADTQ